MRAKENEFGTPERDSLGENREDLFCQLSIGSVPSEEARFLVSDMRAKLLLFLLAFGPWQYLSPTRVFFRDALA
jgi:hypothetical protein